MIVAVCVCPTCGAEPIGAEINPSSKAVCPAGHAFDAASPLKGVTADQLADGAARFVQMTGDLATARSSLRDFATIARRGRAHRSPS